MSGEREVKYKISADASGGDKIRSLAGEIEQLIKTGGDAAPTFKKFGDELDKLANKNQLLDEFTDLKNQTISLKGALNEATTSVEKSSLAMRERARDVTLATQAEAKSKVAVTEYNVAIQEAQVNLRKAKAEVASYKAEIAKSGQATTEQKKAFDAANISIKQYSSDLAKAKSGLDSVLPAQVSNAKALKDTQTELNNATSAFDKNRTAAGELKNQYTQAETAIQGVRNRMSEAGVDASKLSAEYVTVSTSVNKLSQSLVEEKRALENKIAAEKAATLALEQADQAYKEKASTLRAQAQLDREAISLEKSKNQIALESLRATNASAKAKNDERVASSALIEIKKLEGQQTLLHARSLNQESTAELELVRVKGEHLSATNRLTTAMQAELSSEKLAAESKRNLAQATQTAGKNQLDLATHVDKSAGSFASMTGYIRSALVPLTAFIATVAGATEFVRVNVELENISRTLRLVTGSSKGAKDEMDFVKGVANRLGLELVGTAKAYSQFAAATKGSTLEGMQTRVVFEAVARAMSIAGRSAAETEGALNALGQMVSKQVVQMEELRGQLGDRLPAAMRIAADSSGLTTAELIKMVESGQVLAEDLLPKLAVGLNTTFTEGADAIETSSQAWYRFKNGVSETFEQIGDSGVIKSLIEVLKGLTAIVVGAGSAFNVAFQTVFTTLDAIRDSMSAFVSFLNPFGISISEFKDRMVKNWNSIGETFDRTMNSGAEAINRFLSGVDPVQKATEKVADATVKVGETTIKAGEDAAIATKNWLGLVGSYTQLEKAAQDSITATEKGVEARKSELDLSMKLATLRGNEIESLNLAVAANEEMAIATKTVSDKRLEEVTILKNQLASMKEYIEVNKDESSEHAKAVVELEKKIAVRNAEYERALAQAKASEIVAATSRIELKAHADNSSQLNVLKSSYEVLVSVVSELRAKKLEGVEVTEQLTQAEIRLAEAARLYKDAINDQTAAISGSLNVKKAELGLAELTIKLAMEGVRADYEVAKAKGDESAARSASNEMRKLEIELAKIQAQMMKAEAEATLEMVKVKRLEAEARGDTTKATELEIKALELSAQAKQKQADIQEKVAERLQRLSSATESATQATRANNNAAGEATGAMGNLSNSYERAASSASKLAAAQSKVRSTSPTEVTSGDGWSNKSAFGEGGTGFDGAIWDMLYDFKNGKKTKFTDEERKAAGYQYETAKNNLETYQNSTKKGGMNSYDLDGARSAEAMYHLSRSMYEAANGKSVGGVTSKQGSGPAGGVNNYNVNINYGGKTTQIKTASENDAQALANLFRQLDADKNRN